MKRIFISSVFILFIYGCSQVRWYRAYDQCQPCTGKEYTAHSDYGSFRMEIYPKLRFRMAGPPLLPIFPFPKDINHPNNDPRRIMILFKTKTDIPFKYYKKPDIVLKLNDTSGYFKPIYSDSTDQLFSQNSFFIFDIGDHLSDTIEVVFLKKHIGTEVQSVKFISSIRTDYQPIFIPNN